MSNVEVSSFSFRSFDLLRRIVEMLQTHPKILEEFKRRLIQEKTCRFIVQKIFQFYQLEDKITQLTAFMCNNAGLIVSYAENPPTDLWDLAINYTEFYIKKIQKYLKKKKIYFIDYTNNEDLLDLAKAIGMYIHKEEVKENQVLDIKEYLIHDLNNPKNTIISVLFKKSKTKKHKRSCRLKKRSRREKENIRMIIKVKSNESKAYECKIYDKEVLQCTSNKIEESSFSIKDSDDSCCATVSHSAADSF